MQILGASDSGGQAQIREAQDFFANGAADAIRDSRVYVAIRDWARRGAAKCSTEQAQTPPFAPGLSWPAFACGLLRTATEGRFPRLAPGRVNCSRSIGDRFA